MKTCALLTVLVALLGASCDAFCFQTRNRVLVLRPSFAGANRRAPLLKDAASHFPDSSSNNKNNAEGESVPKQYAPSSSSNNNNNNDSNKKNRSLLRTIDAVGLGLKPAAVQANAKAALVEPKVQKILYKAKSCALFALFILYRAYRGFFIIAPAIFRATYIKLENVVDEAPFDDDTDLMVLEKNKKYPWRTRVTVSVLAFVVTTSYILGGALRVALKLIQNCARSRDVPKSFEAAAWEQERNEDKILRLANKDKSISSNSVNGERKEGLAP